MNPKWPFIGNAVHKVGPKTPLLYPMYWAHLINGKPRVSSPTCMGWKQAIKMADVYMDPVLPN